MKNINESKKNKLKTRKKSSDLTQIEISTIYDAGIQACDAKDTLRVCNVIYTLKDLINDQCEGIASGFYRLYDCCLQFVNDNNFDKARNILYELHQSWNMMVITNFNNIQNRKIAGVKKNGINRKC